MSENAISRRGFLAGSAGVATVVAAGTVGLTGCSQPYTVSDHWGEEPTSWTANGMCTACPHLCSFAAYTKGKRVAKVLANTTHPSTNGSLCARGYGYSRSAYAEDRITSPLRAKSNGDFEQISWDTAVSEIGSKLADVVAKDGAKSVAAFHSVEPTAAFCADRLMTALGSANSIGEETEYEPSRLGGFAQVLGAGISGWDVDAAKNKCLVIFGTPDYGFAPAQVKRVQDAHDAGSHVVYFSPTFDNIAVHADDWIALAPGYELAVMLGIANVLLDERNHDGYFVEASTKGFDKLQQTLREYTPAWVEETCGVDRNEVERVAHLLADAKPAAVVASDGSWAQGLPNSGEAARMVAIINCLLGNWNQPGGALLHKHLEAAELPEDMRLDAVSDPMTGSETYPLVPAGVGASGAMLASKAFSAALFLDCDPVADDGNAKALQDAIKAMTLSVAVDTHLSDTAKACKYVLPACAELEFAGMPGLVDAPTPVASFGDKVIDPVVDGAKPFDEIVRLISAAAGADKALDHQLADYADAMFEGIGISMEGLRTAGATTQKDAQFTYGELPEPATPSHKFELASDACEQAGLSAAPAWVDPGVKVTDSSLFMVKGSLPWQVNTATAWTPALAKLSERYLSWRVWVNANTAASLGLADGDKVRVHTTGGAQEAVVKVTQRVMESAIVVPAGFSAASVAETDEPQPNAAALADNAFEAGYGSSLGKLVSASIEKVGA